MEITVAEAARALVISPRRLQGWYTGMPTLWTRSHGIIDSEHLCKLFRMDHRYLMAFLSGYDFALNMREACAVSGFSSWWIPRHVKPVLSILNGAPKQSFEIRGIVRYSYRQVVWTARRPEEILHARKMQKPSAFGGGSLGLPPDQLSAEHFKFISALTTEGTRLPRTVNTKMRLDPPSSLPNLDDVKAEY